MEVLHAVTDREHRYIASIVEMPIMDYCERRIVMIPEQRALRLTDDRNPQPPKR